MPRRIDISLDQTRVVFNPTQNKTEDQNGSEGNNGLNLKIDAEPVLAVNAGVGTLIQSLLEENALNSKGNLSEDEMVAYDDPVLNARYEALANFGINPIRSEIIAISEFIPIVSEAGGENSAKINLSLGQQTKVSVTNVSRLIELHRQIREYVTDSATKVLETIYGDKASQGFLNYIKLATVNNLDDAVNQLTQAISSSLSSQRETLNIKNVIEKIIKAINDGYLAPSIESSLDYVNIVKSSAIEDFYLQGLIEYFIYEIVLLDIIKYLGSIAFLDEKFKAIWGIDNYLKETSFNPSTAFSNPNVGNGYNEETYLSNVDAPKKVFFYERQEKSSDYDALLNLQAHLISLIKHTDSITYLESLEGKDLKTLRQPGEVKIGLSGDLGRQINKVKRLNQVSLTNGSDSYVRLGVNRNYTFNDESEMFDFYKGKIKDADGNSPNRTKQIAEVLSAMAFDNITFKNDFKITRESGSGLSNLAESIPEKNGVIANGKSHYILNSLLTYLTLMTNIRANLNPKETDSADFNKSYNINDGVPVFNYFKFGHGVLSKLTSPVLPISDTNPRLVLPLESTNNESIDGVDTPYMPGPDFFFKEQIAMGSNTFEQLEGFAENYKSVIQKFSSDMFELLPDSKIDNNAYDPLKYQINVLKKFANKDIPTMKLKENIPVLASLLNSRNTTTKRDVLQAIYWAFVSSSRHDTLRDSREEEDLSREDKLPAKQLRALAKSLIEKNCENSTYNFLKGLFGEMDTKTRMYPGSDWDGEAFDGEFGITYKTWMNASYDPYDADEIRNANLTNEDINEVASDLPFNEDKAFIAKRDQIDNEFAASFSGVSGEELKDQCDGNEKISKSDIPGYAKLIKSSLDIVGEVYRDDENPQGYLSQRWSNPSDCHINNYTSYFGNFKKDKVGFGSIEGFGESSLIAGGVAAAAFLYTAPVTLVTTSVAEVFILTSVTTTSLASGGLSAVLAGLGQSLAAAGLPALLGPVGLALAVAFISYAIISGLSELLEYYSKMEWADYPLAHGGIHQFSAPQRITYWYYWVDLLLANTVSVKATTIQGDKEKNDKFKLAIDTSQLDGVQQGILDAISEVEDDINIPLPTSATDSYIASYQIAKSQALELLNTIKKRQQYIRDCIGLMAGHADAISNYASKAKSTLTGEDSQGNSSSKRKLTKQVMSGENYEINSILPLVTNQSISTMYQTYIRNFRRSGNSLLPLDAKYSLVKNKLMYKVLSTPGYGFLPTEKRGNKSIVNVGVPNSMIAALRTRAFDETQDANFLNTPYIAISLYKKDHLNDRIVLLPKVFIFDTSANIFDHKVSLESTSLLAANHITSFNGDSSFNQILNTLEITRIGPLDSGEISRQLSTGFPNGIYSKDVLINHVHDYALKEYMELTTGLNLEPSSFLLKSDEINFNRVFPSKGTGVGLVREFEGLIGEIQRRYPETISDPQLASEVFRMTRILKNSVPFNIENRFKKVLYPAAFDKTYSLFINEKDFVFSDAPIDRNLRIFKDNATPTFSVTSKISRPQMAPFSDNLSTIPYSPVFDQKIRKYAISSGENFPEAYNYYAVISLLPLNFTSGADLKFNSSLNQNVSPSYGRYPSTSVNEIIEQGRGNGVRQGLVTNKNKGSNNNRKAGNWTRSGGRK